MHDHWEYHRSTLWMHYADIFGLLGPMPINGNPSNADCAIVLSFARNNVPDHRLPDIRNFFDTFKGLKDNDLVTIEHINHSYFGGFDPGLPNNDIALTSMFCVDRYGIPLLTQWEIVMARYQQSGRQWMIDALANQKLFCLWPPNRSSYRTIEVLEDAFKITLSSTPFLGMTFDKFSLMPLGK